MIPLPKNPWQGGLENYARSHMEIAVKSPNHTTFRREPGIFCAETPRTYRPKHPTIPLFPASGLATGFFNGLHPKSKFLAARTRPKLVEVEVHQCVCLTNQ